MVTASKGGKTKVFTCGQWSAMGSTHYGWSMIAEDCTGSDNANARYPYASTDTAAPGTGSGGGSSTPIAPESIYFLSSGNYTLLAGLVLEFIALISATGQTVLIGTTPGTDDLANTDLSAGVPMTVRFDMYVTTDTTISFTVTDPVTIIFYKR